MKKNNLFLIATLLALSGLYGAQICYADDWQYFQQSDPLTNQNFSFAQSPRPDRNLFDNIKLKIVCKQNQLMAVVEAESLIESQNSPFVFEYQIDQTDPVKLTFTTFPDSKRKGYNTESAKRIADDLLTGQKVFIRINTLIKKVLSAEILIDQARPAIDKVFTDCGLSDNAILDSAYSLEQFTQDFAKLKPEQQASILAKLKKLMLEQP